jgi:nicotinamidase-related amidase
MSFRQVAAQPYAWPFDGSWSAADTALLVIDMQAWLMALLRQPDMEAAAARLVRAARRAALPVLFTARRRAEALGSPRFDRGEAVDAQPPLDGAALEILPALGPPAALDIVERAGWSAFTGTALDQVLRIRGARNLILCGATTDGAVHATMREANDRGFECLLAEDACCAEVPAHHAAILRITRFGNGLFGTTATVAAIIDALAGDAM